MVRNIATKKQGFTLIELLVVIAIIGILTAAGLASFSNAQAKGRDARRKEDLKAIQTALQLYYNDNHNFPPSQAWSDQTRVTAFFR